MQKDHDRELTFVFFMRHLSQAFHTLLCLPSMPELCVTWSWWWTDAADPDRFGARCCGLTDLVPVGGLFLDIDGALCSSTGVGSPMATLFPLQVSVCVFRVDMRWTSPDDVIFLVRRPRNGEDPRQH